MDLTHIKGRLAAATPGPWCCQRPTDLNGRRAYEVGPLGAAPVAVALYDSETRDVALIANAPRDLAALVAEVERLTLTLEAIAAEPWRSGGAEADDIAREALGVSE